MNEHERTVSVQADRTSFTAADLQATTFPEPRWAVRGLIPEGLSLLAGAPKMGKSWLCLDIAVAIATGGVALGAIAVSPGPVLYAALEDTKRRLKDRLETVLGDQPFPESLHLITSLPSGTEALGELEKWLLNNPDARLVIVDVLAKIQAPATGRKGVYTEDYETISPIKELADTYGVAILVVTHLRKASDDDAVMQVTGSTGLTGSADAVLVLSRPRNSSNGVLQLTGRDVVESRRSIAFDQDTCRWVLGEDIDEDDSPSGMSETRQRCLQVLRKSGPAAPADVAKASGLSRENVKKTLARMLKDGLILQPGPGLYAALDSDALPLSPSPLSPCAPDTALTGQGATPPQGSDPEQPVDPSATESSPESSLSPSPLSPVKEDLPEEEGSLDDLIQNVLDLHPELADEGAVASLSRQKMDREAEGGKRVVKVPRKRLT